MKDVVQKMYDENIDSLSDLEPLQIDEETCHVRTSEIIENKIHETNGRDSSCEQSYNFKQIAREREYYDSIIKYQVEKTLKALNSEVTFDKLNWKNLTDQEQRQLISSLVSIAFPNLTQNLVNIITGSFYYGDCGRSLDEKPDWLDMGKFTRGQKFARDHYFGFNFAQMLSLFTLFSFDHGLKPLILTDKSSTPYTSFKRYLSTGKRVRNWYTENPWKPGTAAYKDINAVRKLHSMIRTRLCNSKPEEVNKATKIKNPMCPSREMILDDLQATCPAPAPGQCPHLLINYNSDIGIYSLNQGEMASTQFGFFGLILLYPQAFGIHNASEEDFEALCHTWRGLGYLLGVDDEFNFCRGTLDEIRQRCREFLHTWVKPNFRQITPEWEHMMRCVIEGLQYYFPGSTYETAFLYLTELMNLHMPRLYNSLSYLSWFRYQCLKFFFYYATQIPGLHGFMSKRLNMRIEEALKYSPEQLAKYKERSQETIKKLTENSQSCTNQAKSECFAKPREIIINN